jgi:hypothetical protein
LNVRGAADNQGIARRFSKTVMFVPLTATDTFPTQISATEIWTALASPHRWPEVLTDLREG